ncbi:MAG: hypothetical protein FJ083_14555 [Cyanobacteria bacterium K_Offshore_surface_m2_239]|nr:hypothetical protein [Cyanobacteria bacterium K_Offshore_surface_m2_239]
MITHLARLFLVLGGLVLAWPVAGQASLMFIACWLLRRWVRAARHGPGLARLSRLRRHRATRQDAELDRLYIAVLARRKLADTPENRGRVRWIL